MDDENKREVRGKKRGEMRDLTGAEEEQWSRRSHSAWHGDEGSQQSHSDNNNNNIC